AKVDLEQERGVLDPSIFFDRQESVAGRLLEQEPYGDGRHAVVPVRAHGLRRRALEDLRLGRPEIAMEVERGDRPEEQVSTSLLIVGFVSGAVVAQHAAEDPLSQAELLATAR